MASIALGDVIPDGTLAYFDDQDQLQSVSIHSLPAGKKAVIFTISGAFTPTCSMKRWPGFIEKVDELKSKGVEEILGISVNDPFVTKAWAKTYPDNKHVKFLADGSGTYTKALGLELDLTEKGLGIRSRRFALFGLLFFLKSLTAKIDPTSVDKGNLVVPQLPGQGCSFHSFRTNTYKLSLMESPSGIKVLDIISLC